MTDQIFRPIRKYQAGCSTPAICRSLSSAAPGARLARTSAEVAAVQALRYQILRGNECAPQWAGRNRCDFDDYDVICDHLILTTREATEQVTSAAHLPSGETIVGCYRLLRQSVAETHVGFYSAGEFDLKPMLENAVAASILWNWAVLRGP